jgi:hypothetical protein
MYSKSCTQLCETCDHILVQDIKVLLEISRKAFLVLSMLPNLPYITTSAVPATTSDKNYPFHSLGMYLFPLL